MPRDTCTVTLSLRDGDMARLTAQVDALRLAAEGSSEIRQRLLSFLDSGAQACSIHVEPDAAVRTDELRIGLQLADGLADLLPAGWAGKGQ